MKMRASDVLVNLKNWNFEVDHKYPLVESEAEVIIKALKAYKENVVYRVEKSSVEEPDVYYYWGDYEDLKMAQRAVKELLVCSWVKDARIVEVENND